MSATKPINFGAGPGKIPEEVTLGHLHHFHKIKSYFQVLKEAKEEFLSYQHLEFSVTELSHRSEAYAIINQEAQNNLRELL